MEKWSKMQVDFSTTSPLKVIHDAGGHFVLCRAQDEWVDGKFKKAKSAIWGAWQRRRPTVDQCLNHDGLIGLVPFSIDLTALDVDRGDWRRMPECFAHYATRRTGGRHLWYADDQPRRNSNWAAHDCSGEVRGARGYAIQWNDAAHVIAAAITGPRQRQLFPLPAGLLEAGKLLHAPQNLGYVPGQSDHLEKVLKGDRHNCLFDVLRKWAYGEVNGYRGRTQAEWGELVHSFTHASNRRFPEPLDAVDVRQMAASVSEWTWGSFYDHSPERQRERQAKWAEAVQAKNRDRNRAIAASSGSNASLAALYGLSVRQIQRIRR